MNRMLGRCSAMAASSASGEGFSSGSVAAPMPNGNNSRPPSPNVNASGGLPANRSSRKAFSVDFGQQSQMARTSR